MEDTIKSIKSTAEEIHGSGKNKENEEGIDTTNEKIEKEKEKEKEEKEEEEEEEEILETEEQKEEMITVQSYIKKLGKNIL